MQQLLQHLRRGRKPADRERQEPLAHLLLQRMRPPNGIHDDVRVDEDHGLDVRQPAHARSPDALLLIRPILLARFTGVQPVDCGEETLKVFTGLEAAGTRRSDPLSASFTQPFAE